MTDPQDLTEDRGFKALFTAHPLETIEIFAPELLTQRGQPASIEAIAQESALPELNAPARFHDCALLITWPDGLRQVVVLIEHWSDPRKIELRRVLWYVAALALQHPDADVLPLVFVTGPPAGRIPARLSMRAGGRTVLTLHVRIVHITAADLPRLRRLQNSVAALLSVLALRDAVEAVEAVISYVAHMHRAPGWVDDLERFLPFAMKLARMRDVDVPRFRSRLTETGMVNIIAEMRKEARDAALAEGKAEGKAEGLIAEIRRLVAKGRITVDAARAEVHDLVESGAITPEIAASALQQLG
jgi:hypothetical protein